MSRKPPAKQVVPEKLLPLNKKAIAEYIRNQLQEDLAYEQMSIKELVDPFTGEPVHASKK